MATIDRLTMKAKDAFSAEKLEVALLYSNRLIYGLQQQTVNALELRASIWERKGNLVEELKDALLITKYDESNISAYLRAAKVYFRQERLQEAIDILQKALHTRPSIEECSVIEQQIAKAEERLKRRIDFITAAPYDIVCNILRYLHHPNEAFTCLDVCDRWREVLLSCPVLWEDVNPVSMCWYQKFNDMVPAISHHVQRLSLSFHVGKSIDPGFKFLKEFQLPRLQYLNIVDTMSNNPLLGDPLYEALHQAADTLIGFRIQAMVTLSIGKLLTICPKLTSVELHVEYITEWTTGLPTSTLLTAACITSKLPANSSELIPFFRCAPYLQKIVILPMGWRGLMLQSLDISLIIEHYGADLSYVVTDFDGHYISRFHWAERCESSRGLEQVSLGNIRSAIPLLSRLERATDSLKILHIKAANDGRDSTLSDWRPLSSFVMHKLTCLSITAEPSSALYQQLPNMLHRYPALERLALTGVRGSSSAVVSTLDDIFTAAVDLKNLCDLRLGSLPLDGQGFQQLIQKHVSQELPTLKSLYIGYCQVPDNVLYFIARIRSLEKLDIILGDLVSKPDTVEGFTQLVAELPYLKSISFPARMELTDNAIRSITSSRSLEVLDIDTRYLNVEAYDTLEHLLLHRSR